MQVKPQSEFQSPIEVEAVMQGACFERTGQVATRELPDPVIQDPQDAIVQVNIAGLCGSDLHPFFGREQGLDPGTVMGHEFVGQVVALGADVPNIRIGDTVCAPFSTSCGRCFFCQRGLTARCQTGQLFGWRSGEQGLHGGQAELIRVPLAGGTLMKLPQDMPAEVGLLIGDNLSTGFYGASMADIHATGVYLVIGCGTVGLLCVLSCFALGAQNVFAFDLNPQRLSIAARYGAKTYSDADELREAVFSATDSRGADSVIELVGLPEAQTMAYEMIRPGGVMSVIGCHCSPHFSFGPADAYDKNLTYCTGRCSARTLMPRVASLFQDRYRELADLITHRFDLKQSNLAYDVFAHRKDGCVKAVFDLA